jgi:hypothetical protein
MTADIPLPRVSPEDLNIIAVQRVIDAGFIEQIVAIFKQEQPDLVLELLILVNKSNKDTGDQRMAIISAAFCYYALKIVNTR